MRIVNLERWTASELSFIDFAFEWNCNFSVSGNRGCSCCVFCNTRVLLRCVFIMTHCGGVHWIRANITQSLKKHTFVSRLSGCGAIWSLNLKRKSEEEVANKRNVSKSLVVVCLDPRLSSIDSIPPLLCAPSCSIYAPFIDCAQPSLSNALLIFAVDIRAGVTQQLQEQVYVAQTVSMMHIKTRIWQVCKQLPPPWTEAGID